ncbi:MAG: DNA-directed RNA polymerase subunit delta [Bacilli bacterium]|nr:DNA-directed RNA polymerase subunit delta [Bacilli bacterium]
MKLKDMSQEELELYSYTELAKMILKEEKKSLNTPTIFKKICDLLGMSETEYANKIGDFYTTLTTDKSFILLDDATWDLAANHSVKVSLEDENDDEETETEEQLDDEMDDMASDDLHDMDDDAPLDDDDLDDVDDQLDDDDLTIIDEDELE